MNSEVLALHFGLPANPANTPGGTNYATSGARNANINLPAGDLFPGAVPTVTQINNYLATYGTADPRSLYLISSGGNDVSFALDNFGNQAARSVYVTDAANALVGGVTTLAQRGARYVIVPNLNQDFGNANTRALRTTYNTTLWGGLAANGVNFIPADSNAVRTALANNPAQFGILLTGNGVPGPGTQSACVAPAGNTSAWGLICAPTTAPSGLAANLAANDATLTRLFSDDQHFAAVGQQIYGDYYAMLVYAPSQISLLAENPVKIREGLAATIGDQIAISRRVRGPLGFNGWVSGDVASLKVNNNPGFASETSTPAQIAAGFDYRFLPNVLIGAAFSFDTKKPTFDTGGSFKQDEYTASLYAGITQSGFWLDLIGTYGALKYGINRLVPIGISIQPNARLDQRHQLVARRERRLRHGQRAVDARAVRGNSGSAHPHRRLHRDGQLYQPRVRRPDARLGDRLDRLPRGARCGHVPPVRAGRVEPRVCQHRTPDRDGAHHDRGAELVAPRDRDRQGLGLGDRRHADRARRRRDGIALGHRPARAGPHRALRRAGRAQRRVLRLPPFPAA